MHRNLKPENVLVTEDGTVKLADFFMSRISMLPHVPYTPEDPKERERSGREARRLWYRAPEMLFRKTYYSCDVDMWALGCLIAEMALGEPLFPGESEIEQLIKIFKFTGTPDKTTMDTFNKASEQSFFVQMPQWEKTDLKSALAERDTEEFKKFASAYIPERENCLIKILELARILGAEGLDLITKMLELNPNERIHP